MPVWTVCYFDIYNWKGSVYRTFDFIEDLQMFLEEYKEDIKKKFPANRLDESVTVFPPKSEVNASDVLKGKFDYKVW